MINTSSKDKPGASAEKRLLLLRLVAGQGGAAVAGVEYWSDSGWRPVAVDSEFIRAFAPDADIVEPPADAMNLEFAEGTRALLLLPGNWVWSGVETIPKAARRQSLAVGYMVEDQLADDVEDLHFVCQPRSGDQCSVYAVAKTKMATLHAQLQRLHWPLVAAIPEYQFLDLLDADTALWLDGGQAHVWHGAGHGVSLRRQFLQPLLAPLVEGGAADDAGEAEPGKLELLGAGPEDDLAVAELESLFGDRLRKHSGAVEDLLLARFRPSRLANLLVGEFAQQEDTAEADWWIKPAKVAAVCFAAQLLLFVAAGSYFHWRAAATEAEARTLFAEFFPNVAPRPGLRRQIEGYLNQASGSGGSFSGQMQLLSRVWAQQAGAGLKLQSLRFDGNRGDMVLQVQAANLSDLDTLVGQLSSGGYRAELLAASELEKGVSGRVRLR